MQAFLATALAVTGLFAIIAAFPQLVKLLKVKRTDEFNLATWMVWLLYQLIALAYTLYIQAFIYAAINAAWALFYMAMVFLIIKYSRKNRRKKTK